MTRQLIQLTFATAILSQAAYAGSVTADFNDLIAAPLGSASPGSGQMGGFGWLTNDEWANTDTLTIIANDLVAPAATGFAVTQSGTAQSVQGNSTGGRQTTRALDVPLTGTVWLSFLLNQPTIDSRGGITFNQNIAAPGNPRIVATGTEVRLGLAGNLQGAGAGANLLTLGETALILGRLTIDATGNPEVLDVWINPDLSGGADGLPVPDTTLSEEDTRFDGGITRVGVQSYSADNQGGIVDSLRLSDESNGFTIVTSDVQLLPDDPNLAVSLDNPFEGSQLSVADAPVTADITVENTGTANTLTIADTSAITGDDAASYSILTALPLDLAPGASATIQIQLDPAGDARTSVASLDLASNDTSSAIISIPLSSTILGADGNLLVNGDFEADPSSPVSWTSDSVTIAEGIAPGSTNSASVGAGGIVRQEVLGEADWYLECYFQSIDTFDRAFNLIVNAPGGNINLRFQGTSDGADQTWNLFDNSNVGDSWGDALALPAVQPGAVYRIRVSGKGWDGIAPTYDIELSAPNSTSTAASLTGLTRYQNATPSGAPNQIRLSAEFGSSPGYIVDDVVFKNGIAPPAGPPVITSFTYDANAQSATIIFDAQIGTQYYLFASEDLVNWQEVSDEVASSASQSFTETGVSSSKRFYYVSTEQ